MKITIIVIRTLIGTFVPLFRQLASLETNAGTNNKWRF